ncbi:hypothetical protein BDZ89DRAFT_364090 [Hymenopellis radicata]|nr:hypothetical protein BDZ89DRAFT_364090 [Hymenopellis radicata]
MPRCNGCQRIGYKEGWNNVTRWSRKVMLQRGGSLKRFSFRAKQRTILAHANASTPTRPRYVHNRIEILRQSLRLPCRRVCQHLRARACHIGPIATSRSNKVKEGSCTPGKMHHRKSSKIASHTSPPRQNTFMETRGNWTRRLRHRRRQRFLLPRRERGISGQGVIDSRTKMRH